jgi:ATPase subunit of ABC transporter with duplicated ATPase domains
MENEEDDNKYQKLVDEYTIINDEMNAINIDAEESKVKKLLYGLGFSLDDQSKFTNQFSGG